MNLLADDMTSIFNETGVAGNGTVFNYDWNMAWSLTTGLWCIGGRGRTFYEIEKNEKTKIKKNVN